MICLTGVTSDLKCMLFPPYDLSSAPEWEMGFLDLMTYNSIPNIEENVNSDIHIGENIKITLPTGSYEIEDINNYIVKELKVKSPKSTFQLNANNNTLKSEITCSEEIDFNQEHTIRDILGFAKGKLAANKAHISSNQVTINKVDVIRVCCNIVKGSYRDGIEGHVLHEFYPDVSPGYKIVEKPNIVQYLPITKQHSLDEFHIRLEDQNGDLVNFRGERINIRVDIRPKRNNGYCIST